LILALSGLGAITLWYFTIRTPPVSRRTLRIGFEQVPPVQIRTDSAFIGMASRGVAFDPSDSRRIYADGMVGSGFFKSSDGGLTWSRRRFGSPVVYVIALLVDPLSPNIVYVGTQNEGLFKSTDYGDTWASVGSRLSGAITYLTPDPTQSGRLFAST
jgi:hypothetical protein